MENIKTIENTALISVSPANSKMGAIPSLSFPPVITYRPDAPCIRSCYARKLYNLRLSVRSCYDHNLEIWRKDPDGFFRQLSAYFTINRYFRMFVSGDIPDPEFFDRLVNAAAVNPYCKILMFTKKYEIVNKFIENGGTIPANLKIIFSSWGEWKCENPYNLPTSNVIFKPEDAEKFPKICPGNCQNCAAVGIGCWELNNGENIAFYKH